MGKSALKSNTARTLFPRIAGLLEVLLLTVVYYIIWDQYRVILQDGMFLFRGKVILMGVYAVIAYVVFKVCDSFDFGSLKLLDVTVSQWISVLLVNFITWLQICLIANGVISAMPMVRLTLIDFVICFLWSLFAKKLYRKFCGIKDALLIYGTDSALELKDKMDHRSELYQVTEAVSTLASSPVSLSEIFRAVDRHGAVIINDVTAELRNDILKYCFGGGKVTYMVPKITDILMKGTSDISSFDTPLVKMRNEGLLPHEAFIKRAADLLLSAMTLLILSPLFLVISLAIKLSDGGPVFYRQKRLTLNGREFDILKFRSMVPNAEQVTGAVMAEEDDPRITKVGRVLRACRLDELPQLINIFLGDMSIVGPRPERPELVAEYVKNTPEFAFRTKVKGGLTGYAQVYGRYKTGTYDKLRLDLIYIENYSLLLDIKLMLMTPQILFRKESSEGVDRKETHS
ncbi:MAG: sugar transferase [Lachnospiraceae bacterium]|nr:sugar transferase [Lachnospiraceae bacterium]